MSLDHPRTLDDLIETHLEGSADEEALVLDASPAAPVLGPRVTFGELERLVARTAAGLAALGVGHRDRVVSWLPNSIEWYAVHLAAARLGALTIPLNTRFRRGELTSIVRAATPSVLVVADGFLALDLLAVAARVVAELPASDRPHLVAVPMGASQAVDGTDRRTFGDLLTHGEAPMGPARPNEPVVAFATSGTTGAPKLVLHTARAVARHVAGVARAIELAPGMTVLGALPLCGAFGYVGAMAALAGGARCLVQPAFDPGSVVAHAGRERLTHIYGPDVMLSAILDHAEGALDTLSSWRFAAFADFSGAGAASAARLEGQLGLRPRGLYGASELFAFMTIQAADALSDVRHQAGGYVVDDAIEMRVADPVTGRLLDPGVAGELQVRGPHVTTGYLGDAARSARAFTEDGWYRTGDLCQVEDDGRLVFHARMEDSLRLGGFLVEPAEIEAVLDAHPAVRRAYVVGVDRPGEGAVAVAFAEPEPGRHPDPEDLRRSCADQLAAFKVPAMVIVTSEIPVVHGANGDKVQRSKLRDLARDHLVAGDGGAT